MRLIHPELQDQGSRRTDTSDESHVAGSCKIIETVQLCMYVCVGGGIDNGSHFNALHLLSHTHTHTILEDICRVNEGVGILSLTNSRTAHAIPEAALRVNKGDAILSCVEVI